MHGPDLFDQNRPITFWTRPVHLNNFIYRPGQLNRPVDFFGPSPGHFSYLTAVPVHFTPTASPLPFSNIMRSRPDHYGTLDRFGDWAFPVSAAHIWNSLPQHVTSAPSLLVFQSRLKTHLFTISYPSPWPCTCSVLAQWHFHVGHFTYWLLILRMLLKHCTV